MSNADTFAFCNVLVNLQRTQHGCSRFKCTIIQRLDSIGPIRPSSGKAETAVGNVGKQGGLAKAALQTALQ